MNIKIINNRKFIKRIIKSESTLFIFYQKQHMEINEEYYARKYDFLIIKKEISKNASIEITFSLCRNNSYSHLSINTEYLNSTSENDTDRTMCDFLELDNFNLEHYYKFISETDFIRQLSKIIYLKKDNYYWLKNYLYGLIIERKDFVLKCSDFGSENTQYYFYANSEFFGFKKDRIFSYNERPNSNSLYDMEIIGKEIFNYFFDKKELILTNFDNMPLNNFNKIFFDNRRHNSNDKIYIIPEDIQNKTYILSNQIGDFIYEKKQ